MLLNSTRLTPSTFEIHFKKYLHEDNTDSVCDNKLAPLCVWTCDKNFAILKTFYDKRQVPPEWREIGVMAFNNTFK